MFKKLSLPLAIVVGLISSAAAQDPYANPANLPAKTDAAHGQTGYNDCIKRYGASNQKARCVTLFINSVKDFCLWAPSKPNQTIGDVEDRVVAWCTKSGYGTRLIPDGTIKGAHFVKTPDFVQVTGQLIGTNINIQRGDAGGELDPHGATGAGNPVGALVYTRAFTGEFQRIYEWQNFMGDGEFCFRACIGSNAARLCPHIYDVMGCYWNEPANYDNGVFEQCDGNSGAPPGVYGGSTFYQGQAKTPKAHAPPGSSNCRSYASISNGPAIKLPKRDISKRAAVTQVARAPEWEDEE